MADMSNNLRAMGFMLASTVAFACMHAAVKYLGEELHAFEIAFFRNLFGFLVLSPMLIRYGLEPLRTTRAGMLGLRAVINTVAMLAFFTALTMVPLSEVTSLGFSAPIFATVAAAVLLRERVGLRRAVAIAAGFLGTLLILRPGFTVLDAGHLLVLGSAVMWALAMLVIKQLGRTESSLTITLYMGLMMAPLSLVPALTVWQWPSGDQWLWLMLIGATGGLAQWTFAESLSGGEMAAIMPLDFTKLIWASCLGFLIFAEVPEPFTWIGGTVIFGSATYIAIREAQLKKSRDRLQSS